jgi:hypothetical protein
MSMTFVIESNRVQRRAHRRALILRRFALLLAMLGALALGLLTDVFAPILRLLHVAF